LAGRWETGVSAADYSCLPTPHPGKDLYAFGDEPVDPRRDNGQRHRAKLEHGLSPRDPLKRQIVKAADEKIRAGAIY